MTAASLASLPRQVGGVALAMTGQAALWVIARYMRAPLTNTAIAALVVTTAMAGSNALYGQRHMHPSPLFTPVVGGAQAEVEPVIPATRPKGLGATPLVMGTPKKLVVEEVASVSGPVGNAEVADLQRKLQAMKFFTGTVDGYYGPQTATAIRKFEEMQGLKPVGQLTPDIIQRVKSAPLAVAEPVPAPVVATPTPVVAAEEKPAVSVTLPKVEAPRGVLPTAKPTGSPVARASDIVAPQTLAALPDPQPLSNELTTGSIAVPKVTPKQKQPGTVLGRPLPDSPSEALEMAAETAGDAIGTIVDGVQTVVMNRPGAASTTPQVGVPLAIDDEPAKPGTVVAVLDTPATPKEIAPVSVNDPVTVAKVQRGLASLGFLHGPADGVAGEATAKAIRNFEVYFNYKVTGRISPELLNLLVENGASI